MDGHQQHRPGPLQPASGLDHPGVTKPAGGVARAIAFARGMSGKAVVLALACFVLQAAMPEGRKPSDLIGSFHGDTESAEMKAKQEAATEYERKHGRRESGPARQLADGGRSFRQQQEAIAKSLETQETAAQIADAACLGVRLRHTAIRGHDDARELARHDAGGCAEAARIRADIDATFRPKPPVRAAPLCRAARPNRRGSPPPVPALTLRRRGPGHGTCPGAGIEQPAEKPVIRCAEIRAAVEGERQAGGRLSGTKARILPASR